MAEVICPFCEEDVKKKNLILKSNTHYLTNSIVKRSINYDGSKNDNKGLYSEVDAYGFMKVNVQQGVTPEKFIEIIGRPLKKEEVDKSKHSDVAFSVSYVFCTGCEIKFGTIEDKFMNDICPKLRNRDLTGISELPFENSNLARVFFLLQIWRSSIVECEYDFKLPSKVEKELRDIIYEYVSILSDEETLKKDKTKTPQQKKEEKEKIFKRNNKISKKHPLIIHYLERIGEDLDFEYTYNPVGCFGETSPFTILMNDFIIQLYESKETLKYTDLYGLNSEDIWNEANLEETNFKIKIKSNLIRGKYLEKIVKSNMMKIKTLILDKFTGGWNSVFGINPEKYRMENFYTKLLKSPNNLDIYDRKGTEEYIDVQCLNFIANSLIKEISLKKLMMLHYNSKS